MLHRLACDWLAKHGFLREAAKHAFQIRDWEYAAAFVEQYSFTQITYSEMSVIYEWCSVFPEEVMQRHPMLCLQQALSLAYTFRYKNRSRIEARLQQVDQLLTVLEDKQLARGLTDLAAVVRTFMGFAPDPYADPQDLLDRAKGMVGTYLEGDAGQFSWLLLIGYAQMALQDAQSAVQAYESARQIAIRAQLFFGIIESTFHLVRLAQNQGQLHRAAEICRQGISEVTAILPQPMQELPALGGLHVGLGCILLEQDHLEEAEQHLLQGLEMMGGGMNPLYMMTAYVGLFRLCEFQDRSMEAMKYIDRLEVLWPDIAFCTEGLRVMHLLRTSEKDPATLKKTENWCQNFSTFFSDDVFLPGMGPFGAADAFYLARSCWVQAQIALGKAHSTKRYLQQQLELTTRNGLIQRVIELSLLDSLVSDSEGDHGRANAALERALSLAQPAGYIRIFNQSPALSRLLEKMARQGIFKEYIERLPTLTGMPQLQDRPHPNQGFFGEALSGREMDVLRLIAQGATNQEIADQLVITVGTVKSHINHILGKLDSHNRTEAVARARQLGLLEI